VKSKESLPQLSFTLYSLFAAIRRKWYYVRTRFRRGHQPRETSPRLPIIPELISAEDTLEQDVTLTETEPMIRKLAEHTWTARIARTVVLKLMTREFKILTRSHTPGSPPASCEELTSITLSLRERVGLSPQRRFRLVGVGLSNFCDPEDASAQPALFT
jgi:DNA polymerase-4